MIDLHVINKNNKYIVFHPESLSIFSVSEDLGKTLTSYETDSMNHDLIASDGYKSEDNITELPKFFNDMTKINISKDLEWINKEPRTLCLLISQACNLRCSYCYADHGTYGEKEKLMDIDTAKKCIDKLLSKNFNNFIIFFGGEPFLNFSLMRDIEEYGRQLGLEIKYKTVTNGTIMNDSIEKFIADKLFSICVSLDGPKEINDMQRYGIEMSVHDQAVMTIEKLKSNKTPFSIKCTAIESNMTRLTDIAEYLGTLGAESMAFAPADMIPQNGKKILLSENETKIFANELSNIISKNINQLASGRRVTKVSFILKILSQLVTKTRAIHSCSAGREAIAVTADGDVYPCHEFVGIEEFRMGNVNDGDFPGEAYDRIKSIFNNHGVYSFEECTSCWARFLCGGDCAVRSYVYNGDLFRPTKINCIMKKAILEALLPEIAEIFQDKNKMQNIMKLFKKYKQCNIPQSLLVE